MCMLTRMDLSLCVYVHVCVYVCLSKCVCVCHKEGRYSPTRSRSLVLGNSPVIGCVLLQKKERHAVRTQTHTHTLFLW